MPPSFQLLFLHFELLPNPIFQIRWFVISSMQMLHQELWETVHCRKAYTPLVRGPSRLQTNHQREPEEDSIQLNITNNKCILSLVNTPREQTKETFIYKYLKLSFPQLLSQLLHRISLWSVDPAPNSVL